MSLPNYNNQVKFSDLVGKTIENIERNAENRYEDELHIYTDDGEHYVQFHSQECCEGVSIDEIIGDLEDVIGSPVLVAEERTNQGSRYDDGPYEGKSEDESYTWTFYELATVKGSVTIRWYGASNGYYSESVDFRKY